MAASRQAGRRTDAAMPLRHNPAEVCSAPAEGTIPHACRLAHHSGPRLARRDSHVDGATPKLIAAQAIHPMTSNIAPRWAAHLTRSGHFQGKFMVFWG